MHPDQILSSSTPKEHEARRLLAKLLPDSDAADLWPADDVYEFLEADGYAWDVNEWIVFGGGSAWDGFDDIGLVPRS